MNVRAASLFFAFALAALPAEAQGPGGGPPSGSDETIQSLTSKLAALTARFAELEGDLEARVAKLEGNLEMADLAGTYTLVGISDGFGGDSPAEIASGFFVATVTLVADRTGTATSTGTRAVLKPTVPSLIAEGSSESENFTWTYDAANGILTVTIDDEVLPFSVGAGGRVAIWAGADTEIIGNRWERELLILTRLR